MRSSGILRWFVFSNLLYGIAILALQLQSAIINNLPFANGWFYVAGFTATLLFYTHAYLFSTNPVNPDERMQWYIRHRQLIGISQIILTLLLLIAGWKLLPQIPNFSFAIYWPVMMFPMLALLYYGGIQPGKSAFNLRQVGWLKPLIIALVWGGMGTVLPEWWALAVRNPVYIPSTSTLLLLLQQVLFLLILSILFDVKDFAADHNLHIKTWVIRVGQAQLLKRVIFPLIVLGILVEIGSGLLVGYPPAYALLNTIPWVLLIFAARTLQQQRSVVHYLWILDGLIPLKAAIGILTHLIMHA